MRRLFALALCIVTACATPPRNDAQTRCIASQVSIDATLQRTLDAAVDRLVAEGFAGQISIMRGDTFIYRRLAGSADLEGAVPVSKTTLYHVASITKYITATLTLRAIEQGRLRLDTPVAEFAPGMQIAARGTTIADLLSHLSGLGSSYAAEAHNDGAAAITAIDAAPFDPTRIGAFNYSNDGYDILGVILERIYGAPYETIVRRELMAPACIENVAFWGEGGLTDPHHRAQALTPGVPTLQGRTYGMIGSAGFMITADELIEWQRALKNGRVLNEGSLEQLWAPRAPMRLGQATFGGFLLDEPRLGRVFSARGSEDWGDNAYLNEYLDCGVTIAIVTSRGPAENSGRPAFRDQVLTPVEAALSEMCPSAVPGSSESRRKSCAYRQTRFCTRRPSCAGHPSPSS